jgi:3-hydroxybutyryl-CoA dehydrogenase
MDLVGLDTVIAAMESLHSAYGERFRPSPRLRQMVAAGRLGRKTGSGFYDYSKREKGA